jgi:hypothetical protein
MNKQTNKKKKRKNTRFRNNRISVLIYILELLLQHISRSSDVVLPGDWLLSSDLFFSLPVELKL